MWVREAFYGVGSNEVRVMKQPRRYGAGEGKLSRVAALIRPVKVPGVDQSQCSDHAVRCFALRMPLGAFNSLQ